MLRVVLNFSLDYPMSLLIAQESAKTLTTCLIFKLLLWSLGIFYSWKTIVKQINFLANYATLVDLIYMLERKKGGLMHKFLKKIAIVSLKNGVISQLFLQYLEDF